MHQVTNEINIRHEYKRNYTHMKRLPTYLLHKYNPVM